MPGYTLDQLAVLGRNPQDYRLCPECKLWWHKCGIRLHRAAEERRASERESRPVQPPTASPPRRRWQRIRAEDFTVTSDLKIPNDIYPWERELLLPRLGEIMAKVIGSGEDEAKSE